MEASGAQGTNPIAERLFREGRGSLKVEVLSILQELQDAHAPVTKMDEMVIISPTMSVIRTIINKVEKL